MTWQAILFFTFVYGYMFGMISVAYISHRYQTRDRYKNSGVRL